MTVGIQSKTFTYKTHRIGYDENTEYGTAWFLQRQPEPVMIKCFQQQYGGDSA
jgi:hypothetical protein